MSVIRALNKWSFWWKARNRHGIHSPFVYRFLDEGLYRKELKALPPQKRLLMAAADHFHPGRVGACHEEGFLAAWLRKERNGLEWNNPPFDLYLCEAPERQLLSFLNTPKLWNNDTIVFVGNLRESPEVHEIWREATRHPAVRVVLETYDAGLLFFRTQQARQHFRIRI